jgi:hypothetical protein
MPYPPPEKFDWISLMIVIGCFLATVVFSWWAGAR